MDEIAFRQRLADLLERPCPFSKAILSACVACTLSDRVQIAERELVACADRSCQARCSDLHDLLRHSFGFAIGVLDDAVPIPHAQEMRIQCGGLKGLSQVVGAAATSDVDALLQQVLQHYGSLQDIPYSAVVHAARECYKGRHG